MPEAGLLPVAVLLAIAPGYLFIYFATQGRTGRELRPDLHLIIQALVASAGLLAVLSPFAYWQLWSIRDHLDQQPLLVFGWLFAIVLLAPVLVGRAVRLICGWLEERPASRWRRLRRWVLGEAPPPSLWDWAESNNVMDDRFVLIEYRDGRQIAGAYGRPGVTLTSPEPHGIYLAVEWQRAANGALTRVTESAGVLVPIADDVRCIHLFNGKQGGKATMEHETRERRDDEEEHQRGIRPHREPMPEVGPREIPGIEQEGLRPHREPMPEPPPPQAPEPDQE